MKSPSPEPIKQLSAGYWASQALSVGFSTGLLGLLSIGGRTAQTAATELTLNVRAVTAVLRVLSASGVVECVDSEWTLSSSYADGDIAAAFAAEATLDITLWNRAGRLDDLVRGGTEIDTRMFFASLSASQRDGFARTMQAQALRATDELVERVRELRARTMLDVGGGLGGVSITLCEAIPDLVATVTDQADIIDRANGQGESCGAAAPRLSFVESDLFAVPPGGPYDVILLNRIIHDWNDSDALSILVAHVDKVAPPGRIIVHEEILIEEGDGDWWPSVLDLCLFVMMGDGRIRTLHEMDQLFAQAGFARVSGAQPIRTRLGHLLEYLPSSSSDTRT